MTDRPDEKESQTQSQAEQTVAEEREAEGRATRSQGAVYQGAFEAVIALLVAALAGYWLDGKFGTEPALLLIGSAIGFASFTIRLVRLGRFVHGDDSNGDSKTESKLTDNRK